MKILKYTKNNICRGFILRPSRTRISIVLPAASAGRELANLTVAAYKKGTNKE